MNREKALRDVSPTFVQFFPFLNAPRNLGGVRLVLYGMHHDITWKAVVQSDMDESLRFSGLVQLCFKTLTKPSH